MFFLAAFLIFSVALFGAGYYIWSVPEHQASNNLGARLRELRAHMRGRSKGASELLRREQRGTFAFLGDLVTWVAMLRRLQEIIQQADLKYRAADVFGLSLLLAGASFVILGIAGSSLLLIRLMVAAAIGSAPLVYILRVRARRLRRFEEQLPDAIDLFTRTMRAGHNIHNGLETIANETTDPVKAEFKKLMEELALGSQVEPAAARPGQARALIDLKFFITSLILQRQTGANMVAVLEGLAALVRERLTMAAKLKAHTASSASPPACCACCPSWWGWDPTSSTPNTSGRCGPTRSAASSSPTPFFRRPWAS